MIFFQCAMLGITFFVMQYHISTGIQSKTHRLLPLVSCTIAVYDFYEIVKYLTHAWAVFKFLEILLVIQMVYVIFFYVVDFTHIKLPFTFVIFLYAILCIVDVSIFIVYPNPVYYTIYRIFLFSFILLNFLVFTYYFARYNFSKHDYVVSVLSYLAVFIPTIVLVLSKMKILNQDIAMPLSLAICLLMFFYLMQNDLLSDTVDYLQEELYNSSQNAYILMDQYFYFLAANELAYQIFPEELKKLKNGKNSERLFLKAKEMYGFSVEPTEYKHGDKYYSCTVSAKYSNDAIKGYIMSLIDITHQKSEILLAEELKKAAELKSIQKSRIMIQTSHDLRSPLHTIIGCCDILMRKLGINGEHLTLINQIKNASRNLLVLVNDMLEFTRMDASNLDLQKINETDIILESSSGFLPMPEYSEYKIHESSDANPTFTYPEARILVVDDMKLNHYIFKELTAPWKFSIDSASDGQEAIDAVKNNHYDLIFLDRLMPNIDGLEACVSIKEITQTPIVLLSANTSEYDIAEYEPYGFSDYMPKPFTVERLKAIIEKNLASNLRVKITPEDDTKKDVSDRSIIIASTNTHKINVKNHDSSITASPVVLGSYINELSEIKENLDIWLDSDIELFRTKVHGLKGISRQLGLSEIGEESEVMEMAAKANHVDYIKRHISEYLDMISNTLTLAQNSFSEIGDSPMSLDDDLFDNF